MNFPVISLKKEEIIPDYPRLVFQLWNHLCPVKKKNPSIKSKIHLEIT